MDGTETETHGQIRKITCKSNLPLTNVCLKGMKAEFRSTNGEWILANFNCTGYYRVNYDPENWERLLTQLVTNPDVSTEPNNELVNHRTEQKPIFICILCIELNKERHFKCCVLLELIIITGCSLMI